MTKQYHTNYQKLNQLINFTILNNTSNYTKTINLTNNSIITITKLSNTNNYFYTIAITCIDINNDIELILRIWKNNLAQIISFKNNNYIQIENIYQLKDGIEIFNPVLAYEAQIAFNQLFNKFSKISLKSNFA